MPTADLAPLGSQQTSEHARTGEWVLQVQPIEPMHDRQLRLGHSCASVDDAKAALRAAWGVQGQIEPLAR
jgi:hypothetical protein